MGECRLPAYACSCAAASWSASVGIFVCACTIERHVDANGDSAVVFQQESSRQQLFALNAQNVLQRKPKLSQ